MGKLRTEQERTNCWVSNAGLGALRPAGPTAGVRGASPSSLRDPQVWTWVPRPGCDPKLAPGPRLHVDTGAHSGVACRGARRGGWGGRGGRAVRGCGGWGCKQTVAARAAQLRANRLGLRALLHTRVNYYLGWTQHECKAPSLAFNRIRLRERRKGKMGWGRHWGGPLLPALDPLECSCSAQTPARTQSRPTGWALESTNLWPAEACWDTQGLPLWLPGRTELVVQRAQGCASIPGPPASPGLTGGRVCEALSPSSCAADKGPCPAGSRWPVTHLSHLMGTGLGGQAVWGSPLQCPGIWKWAVRGAWACFPHAVGFGGRPREGLACELQGGHRKGCGLQGPVPPTLPALSVPKAIRRELAEARRPLPDTCSHAGAQLAPRLPLRAQTQKPYLLPLPHSLPRLP